MAFIGKYVFVEEIGRHEPLIDWACLPDNDDHRDNSVDDESTDTSDDYDDNDDGILCINGILDAPHNDGDGDDDDDDDGRAQQIRSDDG